MKDGVKATKASKKVAYGTKETKSVAKAAESIEKGAARATKVEQVTKTARAKLLPPRENVYQLAKEGKAHGKTYNTYLHKPENQLNKGIRSFEKRIAEHRDKLANPQKVLPQLAYFFRKK